MTEAATIDPTALVALCPKSIFSIEDFKDAKVEWDLPELSYDAYKPLRAVEYAETHNLDTTDAEVDALVDAELEALGEDDELLADEEKAPEVKAEPVPEPTPAKPKAKRAARKPKAKSAKAKSAKAKSAKAGSKKAQTVAIYAEVQAAGGSRKDGIARLTSELGMSPAAASTYWQNCKSGKWS